jgi:glutamate-5-semialdehyde dehydrogenase
MTSADEVLAAARRSGEAAARLAPMPRAIKDAALLAMAEALVAATPAILEANALDVGRDPDNPLIDRLRLNESRVAAMAEGLRQVAGLPDPVGGVVRGSTLPNGLQLRQVKVPLGVVGIIYEARPNVTADAAGLCLKSGNAVLLRGSSSARESNRAIVDVLAVAATEAGLPEHCVQLVPGDDHDSVKHLMRARGLVDVLIPRGGASLIRSATTSENASMYWSQVPLKLLSKNR